jgi:hypothetical protein
MLTALTAALILAGPATVNTGPKVVSASLFKNGYAVIVREVPLTGSETFVDVLPQGALGTLWISGSKGVRFDEIVNTQVEAAQLVNASSLEDLLTLNIGKTLVLGITTDDETVGHKVTGKLVNASGALVVVEVDGKTLAFNKGWVTSVSSKTGDLIYSSKVMTTKRGLRIKALAPEGSKAYIVSLERGAMWAPAYSIDITDPAKLKITAKAVIINDLADFDEIDARLVTGFPNVPYAGTVDPLVMPGRTEEFVSALMRLGTPTSYRGGNAGGQMMTQNSLRADARGDFDGAFTPSAVPGEQLEDLFFYTQPKINLKKGDRGYYVLFANDLDYSHLYTWDVDEGGIPQDFSYSGAQEGPGDIWHCLKFKNESKQPWTTAPATTFKNNEILGQDMMTYTSRGAETLLKITKALDIRGDKKLEEVARERAALKDIHGNPTYDLVTVKETFELSNRKAEKVKVRVKRYLRGETVSSTGNPKVEKTAKGLLEVNPVLKVEWNSEIEPGKTLTLVYTYKTYVPFSR